MDLDKEGKQFVKPDMNEDGLKERQNVYSNLYSQAVTHPSTNRSLQYVVGARPYDQPKVIQSHQEYSRSRLVLI